MGLGVGVTNGLEVGVIIVMGMEGIIGLGVGATTEVESANAIEAGLVTVSIR
jgi:hypothetical protein